MRVGIISDIHGNHYALKEVLNQAKNERVEKLLVLGDIVGYYYHPELVFELLDDWPIELIKGNHEQILEGLYKNEVNPKDIINKYGKGHEYAIKNLDNTTIEMLFSLPTQKTVVIDQLSFQLNHGNPWNTNEYLYANSDIVKLEKCNSIEHDFVLIGHSHYAFTYSCNYSVLINPGSVGQSRQKGGVASWCMIDTIDKSYFLKSTVYDTSKLIDELIKEGNNKAYVLKILQR